MNSDSAMAIVRKFIYNQTELIKVFLYPPSEKIFLRQNGKKIEYNQLLLHIILFYKLMCNAFAPRIFQYYEKKGYYN